jgi:thioredoxin-dependent peroxiredoxin
MSNLEGKKAPAFKLAGSDGKNHELKDYKGKMVVLYFYPKDDTPGCTKEACGFRDDFTKMKRLGAEILGVSKDPVASHQNFIRKFKLPFTLLSDPDTSIMQAYGAWGEKMMYGKPVTGTIRSTVIIDGDGKVIKHWAKVGNAGEHPADVLDFLTDLAEK